MTRKDIKIKCKDNFRLSGTVYTPSTLKGAVMIAPATGIKKRFYNAFATYLSDNGYGVICFDNRGIGGSKTNSINNTDASLINWGRLDMTAVFEQLKTTFPKQSYHLIGHSAGGQLVGLMDNATEIKSMFNFAASSGSLRNMTYPFKLSASFFLNVFIPINNLLFGQTNSQWVGMGEPLPKRVAYQWKKWCNGKGYVETDFGKAIHRHLYDQLQFPSIWTYAKDDGIANHKNVQDMARIYSQSKVQIVSIEFEKFGINQLGHMGFFRSKNQQLWKYALNWLEKHT